jgi:hypothetical protein
MTTKIAEAVKGKVKRIERKIAMKCHEINV